MTKFTTTKCKIKGFNKRQSYLNHIRYICDWDQSYIILSKELEYKDSERLNNQDHREKYLRNPKRHMLIQKMFLSVKMKKGMVEYENLWKEKNNVVKYENHVMFDVSHSHL